MTDNETLNQISDSLKSAVISCLDGVKRNIELMDGASVLRVMMNLPDNVVLCGECKHDKDGKCPCKSVKRFPTDYCSFGER